VTVIEVEEVDFSCPLFTRVSLDGIGEAEPFRDRAWHGSTSSALRTGAVRKCA
jgi:hypothetical protein